MKALIYLLILASIFALFFVIGRDGLLRDGDSKELANRNVFQFSWVSTGEGGRWKLTIVPSRFESFLLVKSLAPNFEGLVAPVIISSNDPRSFTSATFRDVVGINATTMSSYARLPEDYSPVGRKAVGYPLAGCGYVVQADGMVEAKSHQTHTEGTGMIHAVDLKAKKGTAVVAARSGRVLFVEDRYPDTGSYDASKEKMDNRIVVSHEDRTESVYAHLMQGSVVVREGDLVDVGTRLASVGNSGFSMNPHLHFHIGGLSLNGYRTIPIDFEVDGTRSSPVVGQSYCTRTGK